MLRNKKKRILPIEAWGLEVNPRGEIMIDGLSTVDLAKIYGTPLHVVNENRLESYARDFGQAFSETYPGKVSVHYAFKCNSVPGVVEIVRRAGLKAEVMSEFELNLALFVGFEGRDIIINGPCKPELLLRKCVENNVRYIIVDSIEELYRLREICRSLGRSSDVLLRINPDYIPSGMNQGAATGSRKGCAFGLDMKGEEVDRAFDMLERMEEINFKGFHFHIGTGIHNPKDYFQALKHLKPLFERTLSRDFRVEVIDVGGGFGASTTREMTTREMLIYQGLELLPSGINLEENVSFKDFAGAVSRGVIYLFNGEKLPELILEPGRCIVSSNQLLLLTVHGVKERSGVRKWLITDGGLGTVSMPTFYEYHEVFLCNDTTRARTENVTIIGPVCFAGDIVYKNKQMPAVYPGEVLAVMDSGAYFTAMESSFGFPRPAIVAVWDGQDRLIRSRETSSDMIMRDSLSKSCANRSDVFNTNLIESG